MTGDARTWSDMARQAGRLVANAEDEDGHAGRARDAARVAPINPSMGAGMWRALTTTAEAHERGAGELRRSAGRLRELARQLREALARSAST